MNAVASQNPLKSGSDTDQAWRQVVPALILLVAWTLWLYRDTGFAMVTIWARSGTFTHAFLVPPIALWLAWRRRHDMTVHTPQPTLWVLLPAACAAFVWLLGDLAAVNGLTQLAFTTLLVLVVPTVLGMTITRTIIFPLGFLFFAVPIGEFLMPQLMEWTANFTVLALRLSGIPVYREGLQFVIPSGNWSVVEACSGVRYLIASLTVGTLFAYLNYQSGKRRILFVIVAIVVPVLANWMRAYLIVMLGHLSGNKLAAGVDHLIYGWLFFGLVIVLMFIIGARWAEPEKVAEVSASGARTSVSLTASRLWATTACFAALLAMPHLALWAMNRADSIVSPVAFTAPTELAAGWASTPLSGAPFKPAFQNPSAEINSSYTRQGNSVGLYLAYYHQQNYERKLVSSSNVLVVSNDLQWAQVTGGGRTVLVGNKPVAVRTAELRGAGLNAQTNESRLVVWQIYWINGTLTSNAYLAKAYSALYRLMGRGDSSAVIVLYTPKGDQAGAADATLESFLLTNYASIDGLLRKAQPIK